MIISYVKIYITPVSFTNNGIKDVRANCLCASLLCTQFMSQRHATSCTSARAKEEIYSHEALTLLRLNSLGWSVTPNSFGYRIFFTNSLQMRKNEQKKINVGSLKFSHFSTHATSNLANLRLSGFANSVV